MKIRLILASAALLLSPLSFADNILVVMSDKSEMALKDDKTYKTGFYFNELMEPVKQFMDAGHTVTFATPSGVAPAMDPNSDSLTLFKNDQAYYDTHKKLLDELKIIDPVNSPVISFNRVEQIGVDKFDAFFAPGGHAPMQDLVVDDQLGRILTSFHNAKKPTGLVCHGPIALLSALPNNDEFVAQLKKGGSAKPDQSWIYSDYKMTVFSNSEEVTATKYYLDGEMFYFPENALTKAGGNYQRNTTDWSAKIVVDRELITGQNPASATGVAQEIINRL